MSVPQQRHVGKGRTITPPRERDACACMSRRRRHGREEATTRLGTPHPDGLAALKCSQRPRQQRARGVACRGSVPAGSGWSTCHAGASGGRQDASGWDEEALDARKIRPLSVPTRVIHCSTVSRFFCCYRVFCTSNFLCKRPVHSCNIRINTVMQKSRLQPRFLGGISQRPCRWDTRPLVWTPGRSNGSGPAGRGRVPPVTPRGAPSPLGRPKRRRPPAAIARHCPSHTPWVHPRRGRRRRRLRRRRRRRPSP